MAKVTGLLNFTLGKWVRGLHIYVNGVLFSATVVKDQMSICYTWDGGSLAVEDEREVEEIRKLVKALEALINVIESIAQLGYYTYLGKFSLDTEKRRFLYVAHFARFSVTEKAVTLHVGEVKKKFKGTKSGYKPSDMYSTLEKVILKALELSYTS